MKRYSGIVLFTLLLLGLVLGACVPAVNTQTVQGSGNVKTESREVGSFDRFTLAGQGNASIQVEDTESLTIEAEDNILPEIIAEVSGGRLTIRTREGVNLQPQKPIRYTITVKSLQEVVLSGSGDVTVKGLQAGGLTVNLPGSGNLAIDGTADTLNVSLPGSGQIDLGDLRSTTASVRIPGSGDATVWVTGSLDVNIPGSGSVQYYGSPSVTEHIQGSGSVTGLGNK